MFKYFSLAIIITLLTGCGSEIPHTDDEPEHLEDFAFFENRDTDYLEQRKVNHVSGPYYGKHMCNSFNYFCIKIRPNDTWESVFPNARNRDLVKRLNRTNVDLNRRSWIVVPREFSYDVREYSPLPMHMNTDNQKMIYIDLSTHAFGAYNEKGQLVHWGPVAAGTSSHNTVTGNFRIYRKQGEDCISSKYPEPDGGAPMPYCMHFHKGFALHAQLLPGYHASHGCVRLLTRDAIWLNHNFAKIGTRVRITA